MTQSGRDAVGSRIAAADHDHVFAASRNVVAVGVVAIEQALGIGVQEVHREMYALRAAICDLQIARSRRTTAEHDRIELGLQIFDG